MKKLKIIFGILIFIVIGFFAVKFILGFIEDARIKKIKEGWYIEVKIEAVKIRKEADRNSAILKEAKKGEVYKVDDYENNKGNYWYHIEYEKDKWGWIANPLGDEYLNDENNPDDIKAPTIKYKEDDGYKAYYVDSINDINYDHLIVTDDKPGVKITHKVYHEVDETEGKDQYWIQYIATDAVGKTKKAVQKIVFNKERPDESEVYDFNLLLEERANNN